MKKIQWQRQLTSDDVVSIKEVQSLVFQPFCVCHCFISFVRKQIRVRNPFAPISITVRVRTPSGPVFSLEQERKISTKKTKDVILSFRLNPVDGEKWIISAL